MDLIDRKAAIDVLNKIFPVDPTRNDYTQGITVGAALATEYIKQLPSAQPEQRWIPCTERMPLLDEDGYSQKVLVCFSNYSGCDICEYRKDEEQNGWYVGDSDDNPEDIGIHVVAWMPLPEPYKEEAQDED